METTNKQFMGEHCDYSTARAVILPAPFERSTSYLQGTAAGPQAIIDASCNVELYDIELNSEPYRLGIHTLPAIQFLEQESVETGLKRIETAVTSIIDDNKFPVVLGGEHTISYPIFLALQRRFPDLSLLHLDAHTDLRDQYLGDRFSHACVMRRIREHTPSIISVGIRSVSYEEAEYMQSEHPIIYFDHDIERHGLPVSTITEQLTDHIFITFDLDAVNPAELPAVGTPEPGGLTWYQCVELFQSLFAKKNVVGIDMVELKPDGINLHADFWAAKMLYKMIGLKFHGTQ
ncbi:MAG: agmatinase [candidate division KSB1 bacterium]|nr:agmatinase [candidate division KSB1 bacterium]